MNDITTTNRTQNNIKLNNKNKITINSSTNNILKKKTKIARTTYPTNIITPPSIKP